MLVFRDREGLVLTRRQSRREQHDAAIELS
jgi:hypothetical protein